MKKILLGLGASGLIAVAVMAGSAFPAFAKTKGREVAAAIAVCNKTATADQKTAWDAWKTTISNINKTRKDCLKAATTGSDRKACSKTARDDTKAANETLKAAYKTINTTRLTCIKEARGK